MVRGYSWTARLLGIEFGLGRARAVHLSGRQLEPVKTAFLGLVEWGMRADIYPLQMLLLTVSGWVHKHQADVIAYLVEENRVLKEQMKGRMARKPGRQP